MLATKISVLVFDQVVDSAHILHEYHTVLVTEHQIF
jgi:hypothetical protein